MSEHTPGPWEVKAVDGGHDKGSVSVTAVDRGHRQPILSMNLGAFSTPIPREIRLANARLIAAAPELLEACHAVCAAFAFESNIQAAVLNSYELCKAAIKKAEGRL